MYTCIHVCMHACMHAYKQTYTHIHTYTHMSRTTILGSTILFLGIVVLCTL